MNHGLATIYRQDLEYISRCILDYPEIETGGDFFGFWNNLGLPVILYVTGPGENCYRATSFFRQDLDFLVGVGNEAYSRFGLQHIGSWHSHHKLSLAVPSSHDRNTMVNAINKNSLEKFFMILGNITDAGGTTVNGFLFDRNNQADYTETAWNVLETENVVSISIEKCLKKSMRYIPKTKKAKLQDLKLTPHSRNKIFTLDFEPQSWLGCEKGRRELKEVVDWIQSCGWEGKQVDVRIFIKENQEVELVFNQCCEVRVLFPCGFPASKPLIKRDCNSFYEDGGLAYEFLDSASIIQYLEKALSFTLSICPSSFS